MSSVNICLICTLFYLECILWDELGMLRISGGISALSYPLALLLICSMLTLFGCKNILNLSEAHILENTNTNK